MRKAAGIRSIDQGESLMGANNASKKSSMPTSSPTTEPEHGFGNQISQFSSYILPIVGILVLAFLVVVGVAYFTSKKGMKNAEAYFVLNQALALKADTPADDSDEQKLEETRKEKFQEVIKNFPKSPAVKDAEFYLAKIDFNQDKFDEAARQFAEFYNKYPDYEPFSTSARIAEANCYMGKNDFASAKDRIEKFVDDARSNPVSAGVLATTKYTLAL